jgi:ABC-2 type transport system permease protein
MKALTAWVWAEAIKIRRSKVMWITLGILMAFAVFLSLFRTGLVSNLNGDTGSALFGSDDIASYFKMAVMMMYAAGSWAFGFLAAWIFGREFADRTVKDVLALPFPRSTIVFAKGIVLLVIIMVFSLCQFAAYCVMGIVVPVQGGWSWEFAAGVLGRHIITALMMAALSTPVIFLASCARGYLAAIAVLIITLMMTNLAGAAGIAAYYPWSIPRTFSEGGTIAPASIAVLVFTFLAGLAASAAWWRYADQNK